MDILTPGRQSTRTPVHPVLWLLAGLMVLMHLLEAGAARGYLSPIFSWYYLHDMFGFFDSRFDAALAGQPYPDQLYWSVVTYAFLHAGILHLAMNCSVFLAIGHGIVRHAGIMPLLVCFFGSAIAGAITFGLLANTDAVLIGASGGVFGQLGMLAAWRERLLRHHGLSRAPVWRLVMGLVVINVILAVGMGGMGGGQLAWEAHLGGFVAGWVIALFYNPR
ncbi:rhomboid family intramembrane serine protease [Rhodobacteraceae bacterium NNCM2]|nr:rhomboid family intramembrane serine protease [Coraliihabitans acroporae]